MKNKSCLILLIIFHFGINAYGDTIFCCQTDTLKLAYYLDGQTYINEGCDINYDDVLIISSIEPVYVLIELDSINPDYELKRREKDLCSNNLISFENYIFSLDFEGIYRGVTAYEVFANTIFEVIIGDSTDIFDPTILPSSIQNPSYEIKVKDDFEYYDWSTGLTESTIIIEEPGNYTLNATNHCNEMFENTFVFDSTDFSEDQFFAGKTNGENITYVDFEPDSTWNPGIEVSHDFNFDLNDDGIKEFTITVYYQWAMAFVYSGLKIKPENGCEIAVDGNNKLAALNEEEQIINNRNKFSDDNNIVLYSYGMTIISPTCTSGLWQGADNYLVFKFSAANINYLGWMHISYGPFAIYEYALVSETIIDIEENIPPNFQIYPNPFSDNLKINSEFQNYSIRLLDIYGKSVFSIDKASGNTDVDVFDISPGIYLLILETDSFRQMQKVIKN